MQFEGMQLELSSVTVVVVCGGPLQALNPAQPKVQPRASTGRCPHSSETKTQRPVNSGTPQDKSHDLMQMGQLPAEAIK